MSSQDMVRIENNLTIDFLCPRGILLLMSTESYLKGYEDGYKEAKKEIDNNYIILMEEYERLLQEMEKSKK